MITAENILLVGSILIFTSILISKTGYRFGIPTLLLFLLVGMAFGSDGLGIQFNSASDAQFIGMMALSIILFSGGMDTRYADIKPVLNKVYCSLLWEYWSPHCLPDCLFSSFRITRMPT